MAHTCLLVDERERDSFIHSKRVVFWFSLSLSLAREEEEEAMDRRGPRRTPPDGCVVVVVVVLSTDRPKGKEKERKREMPRRPEKKIVVAKGPCAGEKIVEFKKNYQKGLHRINVSFLPAIEKEENTLSILLAPRCSSLAHLRRRRRRRRAALSLSFFPSQSTFVKSVVLLNPLEDFVVDRKKRRKREIFFSNTYKTLNSTASVFFVCC